MIKTTTVCIVIGTGGIGTWIFADRARSAEPRSARTRARAAEARLPPAGHRRAARLGAEACRDGAPLVIDVTFLGDLHRVHVAL
jgi:hypothetical protein